MALPLQQAPRSSRPKNLLTEIETQGTPFRIDGQTETYYVLSASQLNALINHPITDGADFEKTTNFTLEDFGLTETELAEYEATQKIQQQHIATQLLQPLSADLVESLTQHVQNSDTQHNKAEKEDLLHKLEAAMLTNLQSSISANHNS